MRIAFYAPMKPPDHPVPSGDREMARLIGKALAHAGCCVELACRFRSFDGAGDDRRQRRLERLGRHLARRLIGHYEQRPPHARPQLWFTYHVYHKAPDWLGPEVSAHLKIPYVIAEASHAPKQRYGPWAHGHVAARNAIQQADLIIGLNSSDAQCVLPLLDSPSRWLPLRPFIDLTELRRGLGRRLDERGRLAARHGLNATEPLLITVAMMRKGAKLKSYRLLAQALSVLTSRSWRLLVAGDGPARDEVRACFAPLANRVIWLGQLARNDIHRHLAAADLFVWPAIDEAYGVALLEAQAAGVPCVAGRTGGVPDVVVDGKTGLLVAINQADALRRAIRWFLDHPSQLRGFGARARQVTEQRHGLEVASETLAAALNALSLRGP